MLVQAPQTTRVFDQVVCGVDSSPESLEAARQADRLRSSEGLLRLATVADVNVAVHAGFAATQVLGELHVGARDALHKAVDAVHPSSTHLLAGDPVQDVVPATAEELRCDLVALGWGRALAPGRDGVVRATLERATMPVMLIPVELEARQSIPAGAGAEA
jgi:nucleotide-binding universal stress UspA family protein